MTTKSAPSEFELGGRRRITGLLQAFKSARRWLFGKRGKRRSQAMVLRSVLSVRPTAAADRCRCLGERGSIRSFYQRLCLKTIYATIVDISDKLIACRHDCCFCGRVS